MNFGISDKSYAILLKCISEFTDIEATIIFGSRAMGNYKSGSDVDIAIKGKNTTPTTAIELSTKLNEQLPLPYCFDVVHYDSIDIPAFKQHIDEHGITLPTK